MFFLLLASLLFAFSFGLIKHHLAGVDPTLVAALRMALACVVFLPFLRPRRGTLKRSLELMALGSIQYGVMYLAYLRGFLTLQAHQVALFTLMTPLYVALVEDLRQRRLHGRVLLGACGAVLGAALIVGVRRDAWPSLQGVSWVQLSNLAFAFGQVAYCHVLARERSKSDLEAAGQRHRRLSSGASSDLEAMAWLYLGAALLTSSVAALTVKPDALHLTPWQGCVILYLGIVPSGLGFFLWNAGAAKVEVGLLAPMNNLKVPLAVVASLLLFNERPEMLRLVFGSALIALALFVARGKEGQESGSG